MNEVFRNYWSLFCSSIKQKLSLFDNSPSELYLTFLLVFCDGYGYFCVSQILVIFLHEEYGVTDMNSGTIYGLWLASITFWGMIASCLNDYLGVRRSLLIAFSISLISNISIALSSSLKLLYVILFGILPVGNSMGIPMLIIGIKRYTKKANRGFAYGLFYAIMNVAALVSGPVIDFFNVLICPVNSSCSSTYRHQQTINGSVGNAEKKMRLITGNRLVLWTVAMIYVFAWCLTYFSLKEIKVTEDEEEEDDDGGSLKQAGREGDDSLVTVSRVNTLLPSDSQHQPFLSDDQENVLLSSLSLAPSDTLCSEDDAKMKHSSSNHKYTVLPTNSDHLEEQQPSIELKTFSYISTIDNPLSATGTDISLVQSQPPSLSSSSSSSSSSSFLIILLSPYQEVLCSRTFLRFCFFSLLLINLQSIFTYIDSLLPTYLLRCFGETYPKGMIYSINPFMIIWLTPTVAAFTSHWEHFNMIKYGGYVSAISPFFLVFSTSTWAVVMFMIFLSFGEAIWSPRVYDYTMSIAPEVCLCFSFLLFPLHLGFLF
jgi:MFS family permease